MMAPMIRTAIIGFGYWGPNIVRNFRLAKGLEVVAIVDKNPEALKEASLLYPNLAFYQTPEPVFQSGDIDAVAIITPLSTHYPLAKKALQSGKHVFVEKPLTSSVKEAEELLELAERKGLQIVVDHTFLYTGVVQKMREIIASEELGSILFYDSQRVNLGLFQNDSDVIWDLAVHDFSIMDFLIDEKPRALIAHGMDHFNRNFVNTAYLVVYFDQMIAHFNINWLSPIKVRSTIVGGKKKMLFWNDIEPDEKLKVYDKGVEFFEKEEDIKNLKVGYRSGEVWSPHLPQKEALRGIAESFVAAIETKKKIPNDGQAGLRVVQLLETASKSLKTKKLIKL